MLHCKSGKKLEKRWEKIGKMAKSWGEIGENRKSCKSGKNLEKRGSIDNHIGQRRIIWCSFIPKRSKICKETAELWPFSP